MKKLLVMSSLFLAFSCAHTEQNHSCCSEKGPKVCKDGACKVDGSCCKNACGNCEGDKDSCSKGSCKIERDKKKA